MSEAVAKTVLITGASSGIGCEVARQLALSARYGTIVLACRNRAKGEAAKARLEAQTGRQVFRVSDIDVADVVSARRAAHELPFELDDLIMNAGGSGGKTPMARTKDGVTEIFASNVLGHVVLLSELIALGKLRRSALYVGSEAARGVPLLGMKRPVLPTYSVSELKSLCDGSYFAHRKVDGKLAYGQVKLMAALWLSALARRHPELKLLTVSPGNTSGTGIANDYPLPVRLFLTRVFTPIIAPLLGAVHDVQHGAARLVAGLSDATFATGGFYASEPNALTGALVEQGQFFPELAEPRIQDNAASAIEAFCAAPTARSVSKALAQ